MSVLVWSWLNDIVGCMHLVQEPRALQPCIVLRGCKEGNPLQSSRLAVQLDGMDIVDEDTSADISLAVACVMAAYFVYGVQYPDKIKNTMLFLEKFVFGLSSGKVPITVQRASNILF